MTTAEGQIYCKPTKGEVTKKFVILLVDNCLDLLAIHRLMLEIEGFSVLTASSGARALSTLSQVDTPDLILLDMKLEDMSGVEFLDRLEKDRPDIINKTPVIFLSSMDDIPKSKAIGVIRKPANMEQLISSVRRFKEMGILSIETDDADTVMPAILNPPNQDL